MSVIRVDKLLFWTTIQIRCHHAQSVAEQLTQNSSKKYQMEVLVIKTHHVVPNPNGVWDVKLGGGEKAIKHFDTKQPAISFGRGVSQNQKSEFFIHGSNGRFQSRDSQGNDPYPPKS